MADVIPSRACRVCGAQFTPASKHATSAVKCSACRRVPGPKKPSTAPCTDCGETMQLARIGRPRLRCDKCLSLKELRVRNARPSSRRGSVPCHQCGRMLYDTVDLAGVWAYCADCGPGPGIMRRTACAYCSRYFWWSHRGGTVMPNRKWLCDSCTGEVRWCPRCDQVLPIDEFGQSRGKRDGRMSHCRPCDRAAYHEQGDDEKLFGTIRRFSLTVEQFRAMLARQDERCAICRTPKDECPRGYLMVDHDHACCPGDKSCGACVRGLLCKHCNFAIGLLRDDPSVVAAAHEYLTNHQGAPPP